MRAGSTTGAAKTAAAVRQQPARDSFADDDERDVGLGRSESGARKIVRHRLLTNHRWGSALLSATAGYVDAAGFLALYGVFPAHLTGELVSVAAAFWRHDAMLWARLALVPVFIGAVVIAALSARWARARGRSPLLSLLVLMSATLCLFCASGLLPGARGATPDAWTIVLSGGSAVAAMAVQNTLMREVLGHYCPTTVMTGNLTRLIIELVDAGLARLSAPDANAVELRRAGDGRVAQLAVPLGCFFGAALLSGWLTHSFGVFSAALPAAIVTAMAVVTFRESRP
jgi:uncharacterized membrane protein YoaK (UPF0700 family)